jgi:6-pyruvoyltetrahydropterin/6-carboxytetrahydropterin synthase
MFRLTREVRFAINDRPDDQLDRPASNSHGGYPSLNGYGRYYAVQVTIQGELDPDSNYLLNIKQVDQAVRQRVIGRSLAPQDVFASLHDAFGSASLQRVTVCLTPFLTTTQLASEAGMFTRLSQKFEFSASHRLHSPRLSDDQNRNTYGKCNNPSGHGHNYELQVTLRGTPRDSGLLVDVPAFERIVQEHVIERLDHKNLNVEIPEFKELVPTVENIARVIHGMLKGRFAAIGAELASVTVWETPKTWCEYAENAECQMPNVE